VFTNKNIVGINTFVCAVSLYVAKTPKASIKDHEPPSVPVIPFDIVAYGFCWTTFLETAVCLPATMEQLVKPHLFENSVESRAFSK